MDTLKILVVDDEARMRKLVRDFLTRKGYEVLEAGDGADLTGLNGRVFRVDPANVDFLRLFPSFRFEDWPDM